MLPSGLIERDDQLFPIIAWYNLPVALLENGFRVSHITLRGIAEI